MNAGARADRPLGTVRYAAAPPHPAAGLGLLRCSDARPSADAYPVETSLMRADALALSLRAALNHVTPALARAARAFRSGKCWTQFGYARQEDHCRERFDRSAHWLRDLADLGDKLGCLPGLQDALLGTDGGAAIGRRAAVLISHVGSSESVASWVKLARALPVARLAAAVANARACGSCWPEGQDAGSRDDREAAPHDDTAEVVPTPGRSPTDDPTPDDDPECRSLVLVMVPSSVLAAFEETLDLYRAVSGREASVTSFVEDLVADALAGPHSPDIDTYSAPLAHVDPSRAEEVALAHSTSNWSHLLADPGPSWALALAGSSLERLAELSRIAGTGGPAELDSQIRSLLELDDEPLRRLADLMADMGARGAWARLRFAGSAHYAEQRLGIPKSTARDRIRAARGLRRLPVIRQAYERGEIRLHAVLIILRILKGKQVDRQVQAAWVQRARLASVKRMRAEAAAILRSGHLGDEHAPADDGAAGDDGTPPHGPRPNRPPLPLTDADWMASLRRRPGDARRRLLRLGQLATARPTPDVFLRLRLPDRLGRDFLGAIESARCRLTLQAGSLEWPDPEAPPSLLAARDFATRCRRAPAWVGLLALLEDFAATWDDPRATPARSANKIHERCGWRCAAPGCTSRRNLQVHHRRYRSQGGGGDDENLDSICAFHHLRGEHGGLARCWGHTPLEVVWRLGRADTASWFKNELRLPDCG